MLSANNTVSWTKKHSFLSKWNILFDKSPEWISFKPQLGLKVYPCYSCKNMFSSKLTFQDHINRRVIIVKYKCIECTNTFTFYNRCSFQLHARKHFSLMEGKINLANVDILMLPVELAGFARHESIPFLYDEEEEYVDNSMTYINCQFYTPDDSEAGKQIITLRPFNLVFHYSESGNNILLSLKQITTNIPLCEFITQNGSNNKCMKSISEPSIILSDHLEPEIKMEVDLDAEEYTLPVISKIESLHNCEGTKVKKTIWCPECKSIPTGSMSLHFLGGNKPLDDSIFCHICKYIAPTKCSLRAHIRTHENISPYVCPECGKNFNTTENLINHMEDVCFHLSKQVRFRCPAQKCGKLFVLPNTYASHFCNHVQTISQCSECTVRFYNETEFAQHSKTHESCTALKLYNCLVCKNVTTFTEDNYTEHINWHLQDRERCVYIFVCRFCRSYFRSTTTYAVHRQRCAKGQKIEPILATISCQSCGQKVVFREKDSYKTCSTCKQVNQCPMKSTAEKIKDQSVCMLCKEELAPEDQKQHHKLCKYNNPVVSIQAMSSEVDETSSSDVVSNSADTSNDSIKIDENGKKKRKRLGIVLNATNKSKKTANNDSCDMQADEPMTFDGIYFCKLCKFESSDRNEFHDHIITHRDASVPCAYQCMECGECFVVKPSLIKHLMHYHKITDTNVYFMKNDCYDKSAIEELENTLKMVPGEHKGPVNENQCTVCLEQFDDPLALSKHFRIHGMAFLMKKAK